MAGGSGGPWAYREAVGSLMWLTVMSRFDTANAARAAARHLNNLTERHWKAVLMIIEHLLGTKDLGLTIERGSGLNLSVLTNANYAEKADDRTPATVATVTHGNSAVSWGRSTQNIVTLSTTDAEYMEARFCENGIVFRRSISVGEVMRGVRRQRRGYRFSQ